MYLEKYAISYPRGMLKQEKIDVVATHIARSLIEIDVLDEQSESDAEKRMKSLKPQRT